MKEPKMQQAHIEKLVFGGQGLARLQNKIVFVWGALPNETVAIDIVKNKKTHLEALATAVIDPSPFRVEPAEEHFLSCSPWQIISFQKENEWKRAMALETYQKIGGLPADIHCEIIGEEPAVGYRNKMEYSFAPMPDGTTALAFFDRGGASRRAIPGCILADPRITAAAEELLSFVNRERIPIRSLKTLVMRSNRRGQIIAGLFLKDRLQLSSLPNLNETLIGFHLYYSTHQSPASVPTEPLAEIGSDTLTETMLGKPLRYGLFSFFQINLPLFERALRDMKRFIDPNLSLIDFYSGVGAIGIALAPPPGATLVDSNTEAIAYATQNIAQNHLPNITAHAAPAEKITDLVAHDQTLVLDPPRAGLHTRVIRAILEQKPRRILYLSCNIATQARDIALISPAYLVSHVSLYNFFPRTPHIEGLAVLDRKS